MPGKANRNIWLVLDSHILCSGSHHILGFGLTPPAGDRLSEPDVCRRQILTYKGIQYTENDPNTGRIKIFIMAVDP